MKPDLQTLLFRRYPGLYAQLAMLMSKNGMASEFDVDDGWFPIIDALSIVLSKLEPSLRAVQVKQKFAMLRYHVSPRWRRAGPNAITVAEMFSSRVCEVTGHLGDLMSTLSGACRTLSMHPAAWLAAGAQFPRDYSPHPRDGDDFPIPPPPASVRMGWTRREAAEALRQRHRLAVECQIDIPAALFDLADCVIQTIARGRGTSDSESARPMLKFDIIKWTEPTGLIFSVDEACIGAVVRAEIEARAAFGDAETLIEKEIADFGGGIESVKAFAAEMSRRIDLGGGGIRVGSVVCSQLLTSR